MITNNKQLPAHHARLCFTFATVIISEAIESWVQAEVMGLII